MDRVPRGSDRDRRDGGNRLCHPPDRVSSTLALSIAAQLLVGAILDRTGFLDLAARPFEWPRVIGAIAITLGAWLVVR